MKANYTINVPVRTFWLVIVPIMIFLFIVGGLSGLFITDRFIMPNIPALSSRNSVSVPEITGMEKEKARETLYKSGLRMEIQEYRYSNNVSRDIIVSQEPLKGNSVKKGRHIFVVLSKGAEISRIPDLKKLKEIDGRNLLNKAGFSRYNITKDYDEKYPLDQIAETDPPAGTVISREVTVSIVISKGPKPTHGIAPNVIGEMLSDAQTQIEDSGLKTGKIEYRIDTNIKPGIIIKQSVSPGAHVPLESKIDLIVSASR